MAEVDGVGRVVGGRRNPCHLICKEIGYFWCLCMLLDVMTDFLCPQLRRS